MCKPSGIRLSDPDKVEEFMVLGAAIGIISLKGMGEPFL
jgi:hypothetical protein